MIIDHTILALVHSGIPPRCVFRPLLEGAAEMEALLLEQVAAGAIARGFNEDDVRVYIHRKARALEADREQRLGEVRELLEARAHMQ